MIKKIYIIIAFILFTSCSKKLPLKKDRNNIFNSGDEKNYVTESRIANLANQNSDAFSRFYNTKLESSMHHFSYEGKYKLNIAKIIDILPKFSYFNSENGIISYKDMLFLADLKGNVWKIENNKKIKIFRSKSKKDILFANLTLYGDKLILSDSNGLLVSIDTSDNNKIIWSVQNDKFGFHSGFTIDGIFGYGISKSLELYKINLETGDIIWSTKKQSNDFFDMKKSTIVYPRPVVNGNSIIMFDKNGNVTALNKNSGYEDFVMQGTAETSESLSNYALFSHINVGGVLFGGPLYGPFNIVLENNRTSTLLDIGVNSPIGGSKNFMYFVSNTNDLIAMSIPYAPAIKWTKKLDNINTQIIPKYLSNGVGYRKNKINWRGPVLINDEIMLISPFGKAIFVDIETGDVKRDIKIPKCIMHAPVVTNDSIYLYSSCNGILYALR
ncbi:outer membrane protein assembly factor BamB family protein [Candidatus Deianiraea vastatrix]|uniref:Outer membrane protein assembly factor BamB n=1 Tax=Candidatus Deianiraea vastatrix TaxID=2163644 RepID=A0A5B8XEF4_9RICK|nr:PQQ-binding-like beta-propeller repeat protein [Candidatus Deianiraea vastatrix]QED23265.1 Outer membrane protein assembly factor BamB [Candidatus Deianiraea vastatrix]